MTPQDLTWSFPDRYFYLASPYSKWYGGQDDACEVISGIAGRLIQFGVPVFSPITHSHTICKAAGMDFLSYDIWLPVDKPLILGAAGMIVADMNGWSVSFGISKEIEWFREAGKPIWLLNSAEMELVDLPGALGYDAPTADQPEL
jgi:hypothetical protein